MTDQTVNETVCDPSTRQCSGRINADPEVGEPGGFVHALWLLVVLSAFLFGATLVNVGIGIKLHEAASNQNRAIEKLTQSVKEVQRSILLLSHFLEETLPAEEESVSESPGPEGRI